MSVLSPCAAPGIGGGPGSFYSATPSPAPPQAFYQHIQHLHRNGNIGGDVHYWNGDTCGGGGGSPSSSDCAVYEESQSFEDDLYGSGPGTNIYQPPQLHTLQSPDDYQTHQIHHSSEYCTTTGYHRTLNSETGVATLTPYVRVVKRRNTANKKERRRTQSINNAYADLRDCIPNVPVDTKLSKIKTLRLASSYIGYLMGILESGDPGAAGDGFRAELLQQQQAAAAAVTGAGRRSQTRRIQEEVCNTDLSRNTNTSTNCNNNINSAADCSRAKGRTGWPQHVWALELKQEQL